jgi:hypothetical protein
MKYETYINSKHVQGWYPVETDRIKDPSRIPEYIELGILRIVDESESAPSTNNEGDKQESRLVDDIAGVMYANKTDEAEEGSWIESKDFHKVAREIAKLITNNKGKNNEMEMENSAGH